MRTLSIATVRRDDKSIFTLKSVSFDASQIWKGVMLAKLTEQRGKQHKLVRTLVSCVGFRTYGMLIKSANTAVFVTA